MTIHMAKGLEFPFVFLAGLEENLFPSLMALNTRSELEEERRLFYVAVTRAMRKLFISYAESRYKWGNLDMCEPSRFIDDINDKYLDYEILKKENPFTKMFRPKNDQRNESKEPAKKYVSKSPAPGKNLKKLNLNEAPGNDNTHYEVGMQVEHDMFGKGKIVSLEGASGNMKALVYFEKEGEKQLLLKYAKLKIL